MRLILVPAEGEGRIRRWAGSAAGAHGPYPSAHTHTPRQATAWQRGQAGSRAPHYLQVGLLAPLHELVEGWGAQVVVHVGRVEPLQSFHDDLLEHKRAQHPLGCTNAKLMHVVYTCTGRRSRNNSVKVRNQVIPSKNLDLEHLLLSVTYSPADTLASSQGQEVVLTYPSGLSKDQVPPQSLIFPVHLSLKGIWKKTDVQGNYRGKDTPRLLPLLLASPSGKHLDAPALSP